MKRACLCLLAVLLLALAACEEKGRPEPGVQMAVSHEREEAAQGGGGGDGQPTVPTKLVVPPEIEKTYSAIRLSWKNSQTGKEGELDVPLGGSARVPGSEMDVRADVFLPAFTMTGDAITSQGVEATNPATRITVSDQDKEIFSGWIFANYPDVHPFQHPRYSLRLAGGVKKSG
ncbi:MAG TPA: DUF2155 domain-containing protein [Thermoanaerobaculia bacterium]|jgi:hypothetical protein|nr:DUF2155 domain-containing protein [Thermoanaerobaculia bacterium]